MIKLIMTYKNILPSKIFALAKEFFWMSYWRQQEKLQMRSLNLKQKNSLRNSERSCLIEAIVENYPFNSLLDIGCGLGQNFHILATIIKKSNLIGVDSDINLVNQGNSYLEIRKFNNCKLVINNDKTLNQFKNKSFDIVVCSACLLFIENNKISDFLKDIKRIAVKKLLFLEQNNIDITSKGELIKNNNNLPDYWSRNYSKLFLEFFDEKQIKTTKVLNPLWTTENWQSEATLFEITL